MRSSKFGVDALCVNTFTCVCPSSRILPTIGRFLASAGVPLYRSTVQWLRFTFSNVGGGMAILLSDGVME